MKNKYILVLFLIGMVMTIGGALFKIQHWPGARFLLIVGMTFEVIAGLAIIFKLLTRKNGKDGFPEN